MIGRGPRGIGAAATLVLPEGSSALQALDRERDLTLTHAASSWLPERRSKLGEGLPQAIKESQGAAPFSWRFHATKLPEDCIEHARRLVIISR